MFKELEKHLRETGQIPEDQTFGKWLREQGQRAAQEYPGKEHLEPHELDFYIDNPDNSKMPFVHLHHKYRMDEHLANCEMCQEHLQRELRIRSYVDED